MVKKRRNLRAAALLTAVLMVLLPSLALAGDAVTDECNLFSVTETAQMEEVIERIRNTYQMDAAVLTSRRVPDNRSSSSEDKTMAFADDYYDQNGYGLGGDGAGVLYLIDMNNRVLYISTKGVMIDYINDNRLEKLLDTAYEWAAMGQYGQSAIQVLLQLEKILGQGIEEGSFRYDDVTGERLTGLYNKLTNGELLFAAALGAAAMAIMYFSVAAHYALKRSTYRFNRDTQSLVSFRKDEKTFLREHVTKTHIPQGGGGGGGRSGGSSGRGSGVHRSSSGGFHGGGGRHF